MGMPLRNIYHLQKHFVVHSLRLVVESIANMMLNPNQAVTRQDFKTFQIKKNIMWLLEILNEQA